MRRNDKKRRRWLRVRSWHLRVVSADFGTRLRLVVVVGFLVVPRLDTGGQVDRADTRDHVKVLSNGSERWINVQFRLIVFPLTSRRPRLRHRRQNIAPDLHMATKQSVNRECRHRHLEV